MSWDTTQVERFFWWMGERQRIYLRKKKNLPRPWTTDPVLNQYHFCNVFREQDKTTRFLRQLTDTNHDDPGLTVFNIGLFRAIGTITFSQAIGGWQHNWCPEEWLKVIVNLQQEKRPVYTTAYNTASNNFDTKLKALYNHRNKIADVASNSQKLATTFGAILGLPGYGGGGFMAYELVTDLAHTNVLRRPLDSLTWANPGPGTRCGLNLLKDRPINSKVRVDLLIEELRELFSMSSCLAADLDWSELDLRCIEDSCCEFYKWVKYHDDTAKVRYYHLAERSRKVKESYTNDPVAALLAQFSSNQTTEKRPVGRPRTRPPKDPNAPKRPVGRPPKKFIQE